MKYCVIGNSHVGMLRAAARAAARAPLSLSFFAKAGAGLDKAVIRGSVIAADDPGLAAAQARFAMPREVDIAGFDAVIFVAGTASAFAALQVLQRFRVSGWPAAPGPDATAAVTVATRDRHLLSEAAFVTVLADRTRAGVSYRFARALRRASDVPMFVVPQPHPNERVLDGDDPRGFGFRRLHLSGEGAAMAAGLARALDRAFGEVDQVTVLHQPADTVAHGFLTARAFGRDAVRVDGSTPQHAEDLLHVGTSYGQRVLDRVAAAVGR